MIWFFASAFFVLFIVAKIQGDVNENKRLLRSGIFEIDSMHGRVFEKYLNALFLSLGYEVNLTSYVGDWGADLIISKDGVKTVVQAKRYKNSVGVKAIQEVCAAKGKYKCHSAMVVTNNFYTRPAIALARANKVYLWDRHDLINSLAKLNIQKETDCGIPNH